MDQLVSASSVKASRDPDSSCRLLPDYLAIRPNSNQAPKGVDGYDWAVAEAKGSSSSLTNMEAAPSTWSAQVRNVIVEVDGQNLTVPRHFVICTRVHPNAKRLNTRKVQLRCWNRKKADADQIPIAAATDVAGAHMFGLFRGLGMPNSAAAVSLSVQLRAAIREGKPDKFLADKLGRASNAAFAEMKERAGSESAVSGVLTETLINLPTESGTLEIGLAAPLLDLVHKFYQSRTYDEVAVAMRIADDSLNGWETERRGGQDSSHLAVLKSGVTLRVRSSLR